MMKLNKIIWLKDKYFNIINIYKKNNKPILIYSDEYSIIGKKYLLNMIFKWILCYNNKNYYNCNVCSNCKNKKNDNLYIINYNTKSNNLYNIFKYINEKKNINIILYINDFNININLIVLILNKILKCNNKKVFFIFLTNNIYKYYKYKLFNIFYTVKFNYPSINEFKKIFNKLYINNYIIDINIMYYLLKTIDFKEYIIFIKNIENILFLLIKCINNKNIFFLIYYIKKKNINNLTLLKFIILIIIEILKNKCFINNNINNINKNIKKYINIISKKIINNTLFLILNKLFLYFYYINNSNNNLLNSDILIINILIFIIRKT